MNVYDDIKNVLNIRNITIEYFINYIIKNLNHIIRIIYIKYPNLKNYNFKSHTHYYIQP